MHFSIMRSAESNTSTYCLTGVVEPSPSLTSKRMKDVTIISEYDFCCKDFTTRARPGLKKCCTFFNFGH